MRSRRAGEGSGSVRVRIRVRIDTLPHQTRTTRTRKRNDVDSKRDDSKILPTSPKPPYTKHRRSFSCKESTQSSSFVISTPT